jgi:hypothetical protein
MVSPADAFCPVIKIGTSTAVLIAVVITLRALVPSCEFGLVTWATREFAAWMCVTNRDVAVVVTTIPRTDVPPNRIRMVLLFAEFVWVHCVQISIVSFGPGVPPGSV